MIALASLTRGHPSGSLPAGVLAVVIRDLVAGAGLLEALAVAKQILRMRAGHEETLAAPNSRSCTQPFQSSSTGRLEPSRVKGRSEAGADAVH